MANEVHLTGAEYKRFYLDPMIWGAGDGTTWIEDETLHVNSVQVDPVAFDVAELDDDAIVRISSGYLVNPTKGVPEDYVQAIRLWIGKRSTRRVVLEIAAEKVPELLAAAAALGAKEAQG